MILNPLLGIDYRAHSRAYYSITEQLRGPRYWLYGHKHGAPFSQSRRLLDSYLAHYYCFPLGQDLQRKEGGADAPSNMQWQTIEEAKAKDKWE